MTRAVHGELGASRSKPAAKFRVAERDCAGGSGRLKTSACFFFTVSPLQCGGVGLMRAPDLSDRKAAAFAMVASRGFFAAVRASAAAEFSRARAASALTHCRHLLNSAIRLSVPHAEHRCAVADSIWDESRTSLLTISSVRRAFGDTKLL